MFQMSSKYEVEGYEQLRMKFWQSDCDMQAILIMETPVPHQLIVFHVGHCAALS